MRKSQTQTVLILSLFFLSISINIYGAAGDLDPAFGNGGKIVIALARYLDVSGETLAVTNVEELTQP